MMDENKKSLTEISKEQYAELLKTDFGGVYKSDIKGNILFANDTLLNILEYKSFDEIKLVNAVNMYKNPEQRYVLLNDLKVNNRIVRREIEILTKTGRVKNVLISAYLENETLSGMVIDITKIRETEKLLEKELYVKNTITELSKKLMVSESLDNISYYVLEIAKKLTSSVYGFVGHLDPKTKSFISTTMTRDVWSECKIKDKNVVFTKCTGIWGWVINNKQSALVNSLKDDKRSMGTPPGHIKIDKFLGVPAIVNNELVGMIGLANSTRDYDEKDLEVVEQLAVLHAIAVQRKQYEDKLRIAKETADLANKTKGEFLANVSHELRTPLNSIIGFSEILSDELGDKLNEQQKEYINFVWQSGKHLLAVINDILDLSKVEAGKIDFNPTNLDLELAVNNSLMLTKERAIKHGIKIVVDIDKNIGSIKADEVRFNQIMYNLISNAVKFTPDGGTIGVEIKKNDNKEIVVTIWDTGIGIEEKDKSKIFSLFQQIDSSYTRKYKGTGLGLVLTKKLVELHDGKIWFESEGKDKGTKFYFTIPI